MVRAALLVGVSEGIDPLNEPINDIESIQEVLEEPTIGEFETVKMLANPNESKLRREIYQFFINREPDDTLLFYYSGHGLRDRLFKFYLATANTEKDTDGSLIPPTALAATYLQEQITNSRSNKQVIILDCCFSEAFVQGLKVKGDLEIETELGGNGRAILVSSSDKQFSFEEKDSELSIYTRYLVEGLKTGAAALPGYQWITPKGLHEYVSEKVLEAAPAMTPKFYSIDEGLDIYVAHSPQNDPKLQYRLEATKKIRKGKINPINRRYLNRVRTNLKLTQEEAKAIESSIVQPYQEYQQKLKEYQEALSEFLEQEKTLTDSHFLDLKDFQNILGLRDEDIEPIHRKLISPPSSRAEPSRLTPPPPSRLTPPQPSRLTPPQPSRLTPPQPSILTPPQPSKVTPPKPSQVKKPETSTTSSIPSQTSEVETISSFKLEPLTINIPTLKFVFTSETVFVDNTGKIIKKQPIKAYYYDEILEINIEEEKENDTQIIRMIEVSGGQFFMGTPDQEIERLCKQYEFDYFNREKPQHLVNVSPFYLSQTPITQAQWKAIASREDLKVKRDLKLEPSNFKGENRPVEQVSWEDAVEFCQRLSKMTGKAYQLPSEAQWEYACRSIIRDTSSIQSKVKGETITQQLTLARWNQEYHQPFYFGATLTSEIANYVANNTFANESTGQYRQETIPVAQFPPNAFGLYDMHGNVLEWCEDDYHSSYDDAPNDGSAWTGEKSNRTKILRGGSWDDLPEDCRSALRFDLFRDDRYSRIGFRVMCSAGRG